MELTWTLPVYSALVGAIGLGRLLELLISRRNRARLRRQGVPEVREPHFGAMVLLHVTILLGSTLEAWLARRPVQPLLGLAMLGILVAATGLRWWTMRSLGAHWNVAIMDSIDEHGASARAVATGGPYRFIRHPNYVAVFGELCALPLVHSAWVIAGLGSAAHLWVLHHRVRAEEAVLLASPSYREAMAGKPRFLPRPVLRLLRALVAFVRLGRPVFLLGGLVSYGLGVAAALIEGARWQAGVALLGQVAISAFQLMTHFGNEYFDVQADRANLTPTRWTGGSRVLPRGELPPASALGGALAAAALGLLAVSLLWARHPVVLLWPLTLSIVSLAWFYSAPPVRLHSTGWGELDGALVVAVLVPLFGFCLHNPSLRGVGRLLLIVIPIFILQFSMLLAVAVPDAEGDARVGKRTLAVRLGLPRTLRLHAASTLAAFASLPLLTWLGLPARVGLFLLPLAPLALWRAWRTLRMHEAGPHERSRVAFWATALFALVGLAELAALLSLLLGR